MVRASASGTVGVGGLPGPGGGKGAIVVAGARRSGVALGVVLASVALGVTACHVPGFAIVQPADRQGEQAARLWRGTEFVALAVGALVWALIGYTVVRYRRRRRAPTGTVPSQRAYSVPLEVIYISTPIIIVAILFAYTTAAQQRMTAISSHPDVRVEVTAYQWGWRFHYPDGDVTVATQGAGSEAQGIGGASEGAVQVPSGVPVMVLPIGQTTEVSLTATDVVHAFYVPAFLFQRNAVPGSPTTFDITPTKLGIFGGRCAAFCGVRHYAMAFTVRVVTANEYRQWLVDEARAVHTTGVAAGSTPAGGGQVVSRVAGSRPVTPVGGGSATGTFPDLTPTGIGAAVVAPLTSPTTPVGGATS